jgi:hypothetical protein
MSLTSQLRSGPLGQWTSQRYAGAEALAGLVERSLGHPDRPPASSQEGRPAGRPPQQPELPLTAAVDRRHWSAIGGAFGQRLAFLIQHAPPYYALYGTVNAELAEFADIHAAAACWPSHAGLSTAQHARACDWRPTRTGWLDIGPTPAAPPGHMPSGVVAEFVRRLGNHLLRTAPPGQLGTSLTVETTLARACWVLTAWESAYRSRQFNTDYATETVDELLALAPEHAVAELVGLATRTHTSGALTQLRALADNPPPGQPLGLAGPVFVPHWADGDLLVGDTLIDVKTVTHVRDRARTANWLQQLLAYTWLDANDRYRIRQVGLYLARHGQLLIWPITEFTHAMLDTTNPVTVATTYREFRQLAHETITAEGADPRLALLRE